MRTSVKLVAGDKGHFAFIAEVLKTYDDLDKSALSNQELEALRQITRMLNQAMAAASQSMEAQTALMGLMKSVGALAASLGTNAAAKVVGEKAKEVRENAQDVQKDIGNMLQQLGGMKDDTGLKQTLLASMNQLKDMEPKGKEGSRIVRIVTLRGDKPAATPVADAKNGITGATILPFVLKNDAAVDVRMAAVPAAIAFTAAQDKVFSNPTAAAPSTLKQAPPSLTGILHDNKNAPVVPAVAVSVVHNPSMPPITTSHTTSLQTSVSQAAISVILASQIMTSPAFVSSVGMAQSFAPMTTAWSQPSAAPSSSLPSAPSTQATSQSAASQPASSQSGSPQPAASEPAAKAPENNAPPIIEVKDEKRLDPMPLAGPTMPAPMPQVAPAQSAKTEQSAVTSVQQPVAPAVDNMKRNAPELIVTTALAPAPAPVPSSAPTSVSGVTQVAIAAPMNEAPPSHVAENAAGPKQQDASPIATGLPKVEASTTEMPKAGETQEFRNPTGAQETGRVEVQNDASPVTQETLRTADTINSAAPEKNLTADFRQAAQETVKANPTLSLVEAVEKLSDKFKEEGKKCCGLGACDTPACPISMMVASMTADIAPKPAG